MSVNRLKVSYTITSDMAHARSFYENGLGLKPMFADGDRWTQYKIGEAAFAIASRSEAAKDGANAVVVFEVDNLDAACEQAIAQGGRLEGTRDMGDHGRTATLTDPDGNVLQLFSRAAGGVSSAGGR